MKRNFFLFATLFIASLALFSFQYKKGALKKIGKFNLLQWEVGENDKETTPAEDYYMFRSEVTNLDYKEFLYYLKANHPEKYATALYDSTAWLKDDKVYNETLVHHYFTHKAFQNYPVQCISKEAAKMYCSWLQDRLKEGFLKDADFTFEVRLPTQEEWMKAAKGGFYSNIYTWGGTDLTDKKGQPKCAYYALGAENISYDYEAETYVVNPKVLRKSIQLFNPKATESFDPNAFGLFDMCGNVAEMVADKDVAMGGHWKSTGGDVRVNSEMPFDGTPNCYVGFRPMLVIKK